MKQLNSLQQRVWRLLFALCFSILLSACDLSKDHSPEEQVTAVMKKMEAAIEARNSSNLFEHVSEAYKDHKGNDKRALRRFAGVYFLRNQSIAIVMNIKSMSLVNDTTMAVEASTVLAGKKSNGSGLLPQLSADTQRVSAVFELDDGDWLLSSMSWDYQAAY